MLNVAGPSDPTPSSKILYARFQGPPTLFIRLATKNHDNAGRHHES